MVFFLRYCLAFVFPVFVLVTLMIEDYDTLPEATKHESPPNIELNLIYFKATLEGELNNAKSHQNHGTKRIHPQITG